MNERVLYIDNRRVDLPANVNFQLVWQCADPGELKIYGSGSSTIKLPFTPTNDAVFGNCKFLTVVGGREFDTFRNCRYYERGLLMINGGTAYIVSIGDGYEICLTWGNSDYIQNLKDKGVHTMQGPLFRWDTTEKYPLAETSISPDLYKSVYKQGDAYYFRQEMVRPMYKYSDILKQAGVTASNVDNIGIWERVDEYYLQANSLKAQTNIQGLASRIGFNGAPLSNEITYNILVATIEIPKSGTYKFQSSKEPQLGTSYLYDKDGKWDTKTFTYKGNLNPCVYLTDQPISSDYIGRKGGFTNAFLDPAGGYREMYYADIFGESYTQTISTKPVPKPVLMGYTSTNALPYMFVPGTQKQELFLKKGTYYLYVCSQASASQNQSDYVPTGAMNGIPIEVSMQSIYVRWTGDVLSEESIKLPVDNYFPFGLYAVQAMGYATAYDIVADFMRMFPMMLIIYKGTPHYFDFFTVLSNKDTAYDFSPYFVRITKTEIGNSKVGPDNQVKFAEYEEYIGTRADGSFTTTGGRGDGGEYTALSKITSYNQFYEVNGDTEALFPAVEVEYDEKNNDYKTTLQERPNLLIAVDYNTQMKNEPGGTSLKVYSILPSEDKLQYIIDNYWKDFIAVVGKQKTVTVTLNIDPSVLLDFDFRRPIYFKQLSVYVFAKKINYKGAGVAELQGIVLPSTAQGTAQPVDEADGMLVDITDKYVVDDADTYVTE